MMSERGCIERSIHDKSRSKRDVGRGVDVRRRREKPKIAKSTKSKENVVLAISIRQQYGSLQLFDCCDELRDESARMGWVSFDRSLSIPASVARCHTIDLKCILRVPSSPST
jgi:hypothetical protein